MGLCYRSTPISAGRLHLRHAPGDSRRTERLHPFGVLPFRKILNGNVIIFQCIFGAMLLPFCNVSAPRRRVPGIVRRRRRESPDRVLELILFHLEKTKFRLQNRIVGRSPLASSLSGAASAYLPARSYHHSSIPGDSGIPTRGLRKPTLAPVARAREKHQAGPLGTDLQRQRRVIRRNLPEPLLGRPRIRRSGRKHFGIVAHDAHIRYAQIQKLPVKFFSRPKNQPARTPLCLTSRAHFADPASISLRVRPSPRLPDIAACKARPSHAERLRADFGGARRVRASALPRSPSHPRDPTDSAALRPVTAARRVDSVEVQARSRPVCWHFTAQMVRPLDGKSHRCTGPRRNIAEPADTRRKCGEDRRAPSRADGMPGGSATPDPIASLCPTPAGARGHSPSR